MIFPLLYVISLVNALIVFEDFIGDTLSDSNRFACLPISVDDGQQGKLTASLRGIRLKEGTKYLPKVPILFLKMTDFGKLDSIIPGLNFQHEDQIWSYANHKFNTLINPNDFVVAEKDVYVGNIEYYHSYLDLGLIVNSIPIEESYNVRSSGLFCAWVLVPETIAWIEIHLEGVNSYGYLPPQVHLENIQLRYYLVISSVILGLSVYSLYITKTSNNYISTYYVPGVMIPSFIVSFLRYTYNLHANNKSVYTFAGTSQIIRLIDCLDSIVQIAREFIFLLLAMGNGSTYQNATSSSSGRELPARLKKRAISLLTTNLVFTFLAYVLGSYYGCFRLLFQYLEEVVDDNNFEAHEAFDFVLHFVKFIDTIFPLLWAFIALIYYSRTYSTIQRFKSANSINTRNAVKSFKLSIIFIFILPIVTGIMYFVLTIGRYSSAGKTLANTSTRSDAERILMDEALYFESNYALIWTRYLSSILTMSTVYVLWIVKAKSLKITDENVQATFNQIQLIDSDGRLDEDLKAN